MNEDIPHTGLNYNILCELHGIMFPRVCAAHYIIQCACPHSFTLQAQVYFLKESLSITQ